MCLIFCYWALTSKIQLFVLIFSIFISHRLKHLAYSLARSFMNLSGCVWLTNNRGQCLVHASTLCSHKAGAIAHCRACAVATKIHLHRYWTHASFYEILTLIALCSRPIELIEENHNTAIAFQCALIRCARANLHSGRSVASFVTCLNESSLAVSGFLA